MIKQQYLARDWAETVRLYSGLLDEEQRLAFIQELAEVEILLACECRTTAFADDPELDQHLATIAVKSANQVSKPTRSARGLLALAELDKFTEIADFFREKTTRTTQQAHFQVISLYLRNGSENHIFELLKILATSNLNLFSKALDFILELSFESFTTSSRGSILLDLIDQSDQLVIGKIISLFEIRNELKNTKEIFYKLLINKQIKYAEKLSKFAILSVDIHILEIFGNYIEEKEHKETLRLFLNILDNVTGDFDRKQLNIQLSRSLNPMVKNLALETRENVPVTSDLALYICRENLKIGNRSSVEFALKIREKFTLEKVIPIQNVIQSLLQEAKFQRIELAYKLAKDHNLKISHKYLYNILTGVLTYENLALARLIIINEFPVNDRHEALHRVCCLAFKSNKLNKLAKQILIEDLQNHVQNYELGKEYIGFVAGKHNGKLQIQFSSHHGSIDTPSERYWSKPNSIITFHFIQISEKLEASDIQLTSSVSVPKYILKYWYKDFYLGQIIKFTPTNIREKSAIMNNPEKRVSFLLKINDIADHYIKDISDYISFNKEYDVQICSFDYTKHTILCSMKSLGKPIDKSNENNFDLQDKISKLLKKYSK